MVWYGTAGRGKAVRVRLGGKAAGSGHGRGSAEGEARRVEVRRGTLWFGKVWRSRCGAVRRGLFWRGMARLGGQG
jgi:hypothetical protein